jgi:Zn-dependent M28 family amino/carboxypeptidase
MRPAALATASFFAASALAQEPQPAPKPKPPTLVSAAEKAAAGVIRADRIKGHIRFLASDLLEGRGPATRGDRLAQAYIAAQMEALGLSPGAPGGGFLQPFDIVGVTSRSPQTIALLRGDRRLELRHLDDFVVFSGVQTPEARLENAEIVFVGYGIVAPEFQWDDYKGADLKGKVLLMMNNDPEDDPGLFAGKTRLYYGRWDYKYEMAARAGAAGAIIIHTEPSAGYKWQVVQSSWSGEQFDVPHQGGPQLPVKAWATEEASRRLCQLAGQDMTSLLASARKRDFRPLALGVTLSLTLRNEVSRKQTANVIGRLVGNDPLLSKEAVLYSSHHDHLGIGQGQGDTIHNGAMDNASGVAAMLVLAEAFQALKRKPARTLYFAAVAAEEQGLLGSAYLAAHPPVEPGRLAANVNIDGINIWGRTKDITMIGLGKSNLDDWIKALLATQGRHVVPDQFPDKGFFYRSDQFSLAKIGVPAAYFEAGTEVIGKPAGWGKQAQQEFEDKHYHQPSDELREDWNFDGAIEDVQLFFYLGLKVANSQRMPAWKPGDEFEAARKEALAALRER